MIKLNSWSCISLGMGVALISIASFGSGAMAQYGADQGYQSNEKDSGIYGDAPSGLDPLDIMHRAQQTSGRSAAEFGEESQTQLNNSASDFKRLQQQRILEQQQSRNATEVEAETTETVE